MAESRPMVSIVILAYGDQPLLGDCVKAATSSPGIDAEVVIVDNGCNDKEVLAELAAERVKIVDPGKNLGFAGGVNLGASLSDRPFLVLLNSDAVPCRAALASLVATLADPTVGLVTASLRLLRQPELMNSCGNPVHYAGLSWAGCNGQSAANHQTVRAVASASGAAFACRRETWVRLGGFCEPMFAYHEDTDLSLRCWAMGLRVVYQPDAVVLHDYEFSRNERKLGLVERNRLITIMTLYEVKTLVVLGPFLVGLELMVILLAARQGWLKQKLTGWWWLVAHTKWLWSRRRETQASRTQPDAALIPLLTDRFEPGEGLTGRRLVLFNYFSQCYWSVARRLLQ